MSVLKNIEKRIECNSDGDNFQYYDEPKYSFLKRMQSRLDARGGMDQWTRMRQDKLRSLKKALFSSYQSAIVQKYDVESETLINKITDIINILQNKQNLDENQIKVLDQLENEYSFLTSDRESVNYIIDLKEVIEKLKYSQPYFRCLINHDKLKVSYQDKIISIPFEECPVGSEGTKYTDFHNGTVFKWIHGNKEEWTPDTYWIVYMQYSEQTAYFRAQIRKADQEIQIVTVDDEGNEKSVQYRGWMTGPNQTSALWNTKKGVIWNDLNYTKLLYITKDENTLAFFQRFDRIIINGKPWEVQAYNENYSVNKRDGVESGIIRVALKETYTTTDQFIKETISKDQAKIAEKTLYDSQHTDPYIDGPSIARPYDIITFKAKNFEDEYDSQGLEILKYWSLFGTQLAEIIETSLDRKTIKVKILTEYGNKKGFFVNYGENPETMVHVEIKSL